MTRCRIIDLFLLGLCLTVPASLLAESGRTYPDRVVELVEETRKSISSIDMEQFKEVLDSKAYDMIVDVREPDEYARGRVPDAMNIPRGVIEFRIWRYIGFPDNTDTGKRIYLYCGSGSRCTLAAKSLQDLGFSRVVAVNMTFKAWQDAGYPVVK